jgi:hypothetical protein
MLDKMMKERRIEQRLLCAEFVEVEWRLQDGRKLRAMTSLEDISQSGACLQLEFAIPLQTPVCLHYAQGQLAGTIRHCVHREIGYFLGVEFEPGQEWNERSFKPQHLFDPRQLIQLIEPT